MLTPVVRVAEWIGALPVWLQWYLRPAADYTTFTLLPWAGFVFAGAAAGVASGGAAKRAGGAALAGRDGRRGRGSGRAGVLYGPLPTIYRASSFWTSSPTYFAIRIGILMLGAGSHGRSGPC